MAISLKHLFQSAKTDGPDNTIVQPSDWNDEHVLTLDEGKIVGRAAGAGTGAAQELPVSVATDGSTIISGSSSNAMLRITQTGVGNALLVEDSANPDSTPFVVDSNGNVGIAKSVPTAKLDVNGTANFNSQFKHDTSSNPGLGYAYGPSYGGFWGRYAYTGTLASGVNGNLWNITSDDATITGSNFLNGVTVQHQFGGSNMQGGRQALFATARQTAASNASNANRCYVGAALTVFSNTGDGGTGLTSTTAKGQYFGFNPVVTLANGAENAYDACAGEVNVSVETGASTYYKAGLRICSLGSDKVQGVASDAQLSLTNQPGAVGWKNAITLSDESGQYPLTATGTVLNAYNGTFATGIDFSQCTISSAAFKSPSFIVAGNGRTVIGTTSAVIASSGATNPLLQVHGTTSSSSMSASRWSNDANQPFVFLTKSRSSTVGTYGTIVQSGDTIGSIVFSADDGANPIQAASINAVVDGTPGLNDMPGRLVFSTTADGATPATPTERMRIDNQGRIGVGGSAYAGVNFLLAKNISGATSSYGFLQTANVQSDVIGAYPYLSAVGTQATTFTLTELHHFRAQQGTFGAGSTVGNQVGFIANASLIGATNNYGFYGNIPSGTGRWNFYANGTAPNYFGGNVGISQTDPNNYLCVGPGTGTGSAPTYTGYIRIGWHPSQSLNSNGGLEFVSAISGSGYGWRVAAADLGAGDVPFVIQNRNSSATWTERMRVDASGNVGIGTASPVNKLQVNGSFGRGAPVTKTGDFTLADTENWIICNGTGSITVTLPAASSWTGRELTIKTVAAQTVVSASSNVVPLAGGSAGTAILAATAGKFATLVSDGTNWVIMAGN